MTTTAPPPLLQRKQHCLAISLGLPTASGANTTRCRGSRRCTRAAAAGAITTGC